ncbi:hypothetical protein N0V90_011843 [Kalmusia sp. IMI 367209]|nr:hypothetical protein N0V90_011843 [Kalmusia sp. IMI 367209]
MRSTILYYSTAVLAACAFASPISIRDEAGVPHNGGGHSYHGDKGHSYKGGEDDGDYGSGGEAQHTGGTGVFSFPLPDGFPNPSPDQINDIQIRAHGNLPNTPLPTNLSPEGITNFKLIAFNELFEVAFFYELVQNITNDVQGYAFGGQKDKILEDLQVIVAVEELHALSPCKYSFPVTDYDSAIALAATFTDIVLGTLQDVNQIFSQNGDNAPVRLVSSVIGNEGEQEGLFRVIQEKTTPAQPFLTTSVRDFAFTAIQGFVVPGSCPNIDTIPLTTFKPLNVLTQNILPKTQTLEFSFEVGDYTGDLNALSLVLVNALNTPIVETLDNLQNENGVVTFTAGFPFDQYLLHGLTIAAVTNSAGPFADADAVAQNTIFAPGLIEVE